MSQGHAHDGVRAADGAVTCRRCGGGYTLDAGPTMLAACPHCGAAPAPLLRRINRNGVAAVLALAAAVVLALAFVTPMLAMATLGEVRTFSLVGGIAELWRRGERLIAAVLFLFSVIFPVLKLALLLTATSRYTPLAARWRRRLHHLAAATGKYSLLDVLVIAVMVVLVKFEGMVEVEARAGTLLFCVAVLLSMAAGWCAYLSERKEGEGKMGGRR